MEPAKIDWKSLESVYVIDPVYDNINAPQWFDFLAPHYSEQVDDDAWFCRPDCKHPKTAEDFLKSTPTSKLLRSVSVSKLIGLGDWTRREANLKRRGVAPSSTTADDDSENQNPNLTTPDRQFKSLKAAIKSSADKEDEYKEIMLGSDEKPRLKSSQSARDLFGGRDIFGKITEFCNELKKMAMKAKVEEAEMMDSKIDRKPLEVVRKKEGSGDVSGSSLEKTSEREKERKPLLEVSKERYEAGEKSNPISREKLRNWNKKKGADEAENIIPVSLNLKDVKGKEEGRLLLPIRTNPPTPQGFSATRDPTKSTPLKGPKSRLMEREILQEVEQKKTGREEIMGEKTPSPKNNNASPFPAREKEGRTLDVFWFLKPCTLSS